MHVMTIYGTRPEGIKMAPVVRALNADARFTCTTVVTGQHREMLAQVNELFDITPDVVLDVFEAGQSLNQLMAKLFAALDPVLVEHLPDAVVVQGDTSTVTAAAIAAFHRGIKVVHMEAGLRTWNLRSPFPEEANRKLTAQIASLHLAPTRGARANLLRENVAPERITVTGNTVVDALLHTIGQEPQIAEPLLAAAVEAGKRMVLVTSHRRENWGRAMEGMGRAIQTLAKRYPDHVFAMPLHLNPRVREAILPSVQWLPNVIVTGPLPYADFSRAMLASQLILTDSGGVQEEAPALGKPVLLMRENTERPEGVEAGTVRLVGTDPETIVEETSKLLADPEEYAAMARAVNPFGDGAAAERTVAAIAAMLGQGERLPDFDAH